MKQNYLMLIVTVPSRISGTSFDSPLGTRIGHHSQLEGFITY